MRRDCEIDCVTLWDAKIQRVFFFFHFIFSIFYFFSFHFFRTFVRSVVRCLCLFVYRTHLRRTWRTLVSTYKCLVENWFERESYKNRQRESSVTYYLRFYILLFGEILLPFTWLCYFLSHLFFFFSFLSVFRCHRQHSSSGCHSISFHILFCFFFWGESFHGFSDA